MIYDGEWKDNKWDGKGKMIYSNGIIYEGIWKNGKMVNIRKNNWFTNGTIYKSLWKDDNKILEKAIIECPICFDIILDSYKTKCDHTLCIINLRKILHIQE